MLMLENYLQDVQYIADLGSGRMGSYWWQLMPSHVCLDAFDLYHKTTKNQKNIKFFKKDATKLANKKAFAHKYDLIVADHIFEHVVDPKALAISINYICKPNGIVHIGIPDATNFTDMFYRLIHPDSGGHIQQFDKQSMIELMENNGFKLLDAKIWPDDWRWLDVSYNRKKYKVKYLEQHELEYMANVFRKELTPDRGYYYGWEYIFQKTV